jgi:hypothetical protein
MPERERWRGGLVAFADAVRAYQIDPTGIEPVDTGPDDVPVAETNVVTIP